MTSSEVRRSRGEITQRPRRRNLRCRSWQPLGGRLESLRPRRRWTLPGRHGRRLLHRALKVGLPEGAAEGSLEVRQQICIILVPDKLGEFARDVKTCKLERNAQ